MQQVFAAIGKVMGSGRLRPELLGEVSSAHGAIVDGHKVHVRHLSRDEIGDRRGRYEVEILGERWLDGGKWTFRSGELERLARATSQEV